MYKPLPSGACDAHLHVFEGDLPAYKALQERLGLTRAVIVQPRKYGTDNTILLAAIAGLGQAKSRGIAVIHPDISDTELQRLNAGGICGVRMSLHSPVDAAVGFDMLEPLAERIAPLGWHLQLHFTAQQIAAHSARLLALKVPMVFDHFARLPLESFDAHPAYAVVATLLAREQAWVKLSAPYLITEASHYDKLQPLAQALIAQAPKRMLFGTDWSHVTEPLPKPDTVALRDVVSGFAPDPEMLKRIWVDNPTILYQFKD